MANSVRPSVPVVHADPTEHRRQIAVALNLLGQVFVPRDRLGVSADNGDAAATLAVGSSEAIQIWGTALTADRAVTLATDNAGSGDQFHIVRTAAATGAFSLNVGTGPLKALDAGEWCRVTYDGSAWILIAAGSL